MSGWLWQPLIDPGGVAPPIETGEESDIFAQEEADYTWPFDDLKPRDIGIYPVAAPIGGGLALTQKEPVVHSGNGFWRIVLGAIPVKTRAKILQYRALESQLEGRGRTVAIPIYDGKRAPWPGTPGGAISAMSDSDVPEGSTNINILVTDAGEISVGMHFSAGSRLYRIIAMNAESSVLSCIIWPKTREQIPAGTALDFRRPVCIMRLAQDDGMSMTLDGLKRGEASIEFVEAL